MPGRRKKIKVVDLFCGIGGLSHGLIQAGFEVVAGVDNDDSCRFQTRVILCIELVS